nr:hypothetical protein PanWU01x14_074930 [Ipomoea batatas]
MSSLRAEIWESRALMVSTFCVSSLASASASSASTFLRPSASFCSTSSCVSFFILLSAADISARAAFITAAPCSSSCFTSADVSFTLNRISAMIIGSVRLKSNSDAFSISSAIDGGATARAVPRITDRDFKLEERGRVRERNWLRFGSSERVNLGREAEILSLGEGRAVGIRAFEEAMIIKLKLPKEDPSNLRTVSLSGLWDILLYEKLLLRWPSRRKNSTGQDNDPFRWNLIMGVLLQLSSYACMFTIS